MKYSLINTSSSSKQVYSFIKFQILQSNIAFKEKINKDTELYITLSQDEKRKFLEIIRPYYVNYLSVIKDVFNNEINTDKDNIKLIKIMFYVKLIIKSCFSYDKEVIFNIYTLIKDLTSKISLSKICIYEKFHLLDSLYIEFIGIVFNEHIYLNINSHFSVFEIMNRNEIFLETILNLREYFKFSYEEINFFTDKGVKAYNLRLYNRTILLFRVFNFIKKADGLILDYVIFFLSKKTCMKKNHTETYNIYDLYQLTNILYMLVLLNKDYFPKQIKRDYITEIISLYSNNCIEFGSTNSIEFILKTVYLLMNIKYNKESIEIGHKLYFELLLKIKSKEYSDMSNSTQLESLTEINTLKENISLFIKITISIIKNSFIGNNEMIFLNNILLKYVNLTYSSSSQILSLVQVNEDFKSGLSKDIFHKFYLLSSHLLQRYEANNDYFCSFLDENKKNKGFHLFLNDVKFEMTSSRNDIYNENPQNENYFMKYIEELYTIKAVCLMNSLDYKRKNETLFDFNNFKIIFPSNNEELLKVNKEI